MSKSQTELCARALHILGVIGAGQSGQAEDMAIAQAAIEPLAAELSALNVCHLDLTDDTDRAEIPDELFSAVARLLAMDIASMFGQPEPPDAAKIEAMKPIRRITAIRGTGEVLEANYF